MIPYLEHHLVDHCNLNCYGCSHFSPICDPWFEDIEDFKRDFSKLAEITNKEVDIIRLMGGEPLLHPQLNDFLISCRELFPNTHIELVTNGILIQKRKNEILQVCNDYRITICISDYGILDVQKNLQDFKYIRAYSKVTSMYSLCIDPTGSQNAIYSYSRCDMHNARWFYFQYGKFYPCCVLGTIHFFNNHFKDILPNPIYTNEDDIGISIYDHNIDEILAFLLTPREICKFCDVDKRHSTEHPFAISKGELTEWIPQ